VGGIRTLIAVVIVGGSLLLLALYIRGRSGDAGTPSSVAAVEEELQPDLKVPTNLDSNSPPANDRASFVETLPGTNPLPTPTTGGSLSVRLLDPSGAPILGEQAAVSLIDAYGHYRQSSHASKTSRHEIQGLAFGPYTLVADAEGYLRLEERVDLGADRADVRKDITLTPHPRIRVRVITPDGLGLREALAAESLEARGLFLVPVATRELPGETMEEIQGSVNNRFGVGRFTPNAPGLTREHIGVILLHGELPVHVSLVHYQHVLQTVEVQPGGDEATFVLSVEALLASTATICLRLEEEPSGRAISNAGVLVRGLASSSLNPGPDGMFTARGIPPGRYRLLIVSRTHSQRTLSFVAKPGLNDLGVVRLEEALSMIVRVVDEEGTPRRANFFLRVLDPETRRVVDPEEELMHGHEETGVLELTQLGRELYCLQVAPSKPRNEEAGVDWTWVSENVILDTRNGPIADREVVLRRPASLVLRTDDPDPHAWTIQIYDEQDLWVKASRLDDRLPKSVDLAPGTYRVAVCDLERRELSSRFVTLGKEPVVLELSR
jgi:hypothetical protein